MGITGCFSRPRRLTRRCMQVWMCIPPQPTASPRVRLTPPVLVHIYRNGTLNAAVPNIGEHTVTLLS